MRKETIPLRETNCFSKTFIDYISGNKKLTPHYRAFPAKENFKEVIESKNFDEAKRKALVETLFEDYLNLETSESVLHNINLLKKDKAFTITTGHQLNIFTGPLYFIYKIITVITTCRELKKTYSDYDFIPIYWMASEDHDAKEISSFRYEGKKIEWQTDQTGAVGRFDPASLQEIAKSLPERASFFVNAYKNKNLAQAVRSYVNHLFKDEGLIVVDGDDSRLKRSLIQVIEEDLFTHTPETLVSQTTKTLASAGYKAQVFPRQINFFYLKNHLRERIVRTTKGFEVVGKAIQFSNAEIKELIQAHPEQFSPNVILRPLYQELILPNLAYVGGPSELVYWLQLKAIFEYFEVPFPLLVPRSFAMICSKKDQVKWNKTGLTTKDLFLSVDKAFSKWIPQNINGKVNYTDEIEILTELSERMKLKASGVDPTLTQHLEALHTGFRKKIRKAEKKILRAEKRKHSEKREQIESVKKSLFPGGSLQEREENFLPYYIKDPQFVQELINQLDPFHFEMHLLFE
ncbi:MAG: bacillithiol biosynthesis cysteine-adding enzyme BshC [Bacteroidota bacterium]